MDYTEFHDKVMYRYDHFKQEAFNYVKNYVSGSSLYHVVVHKEAFEKVLAKLCINILVFECSLTLERDNHAHLLLWSRYPYDSSQNIRAEKIENMSHCSSIRQKFLSERHDIFCDVEFDVSLKVKSMKAVLSSLSYSGHIDRLFLPTKSVRNLFQQNKSHYDFPEYDGKTVIDNEYLTEIDRWYSKQFVISYQNTPKIYKEKIYVIFLRFDANYKKWLMCLNCMKLEIENGCYRREYLLVSIFDEEIFVKDPLHWCHVCKQVPLFQTITENDVYKYYKSNVDIKWPTVLKIDYFKNGVVIKSEYKNTKA